MFMKKLMLVLVALSVLFLVVAAMAADMSTVNGYVSDSKCAAKGTSEKHAACAKKCIAAGEKMVVVTDGDNKILTVDNPDALTGHEGHHVAVTGSVKGDMIHVDSVKMM
jgi:type 1 fimbria pilin